jgi:hypothetical protein
MKTLSVKTLEFYKFLDSLGRLSDKAIITIKDNVMMALSNTAGGAIVLLAELPVTSDGDAVLNLPSIKRLQNALKLCNKTDVSEFKLKNNHLEYKGSGFKFKYHLHEDGMIVTSRLNPSKLKAFTFDTAFTLSPMHFRNIMKAASAFQKVNKVYLYTENDVLKLSLKDDKMPNTDAFTMDIMDMQIELEPFIMTLDELRCIMFDKCDINVDINQKIGNGKLEFQLGDLKLSYNIVSLQS